MTLRTTALQFGYFFALLFAVLLWLRGSREERLSDKLLGFVMFFLAMEIQDYTFGFAGINILWEDLNWLPRHFPWVFPATVFFYIHAQTNQEFKFEKKHFWHLIPYLVYVAGNLIISFLLSDKRRQWLYNSNLGVFLNIFDYLIVWVGIIFYFTKSIQHYKKYKKWIVTQFSDTENVSFTWLRNFIYVFIAGAILHLIFLIADFTFDLPYEQDFYWQLFTVCIIIYVGVWGYSQPQPKRILFKQTLELNPQNEKTAISETEYLDWKPKIEKLFTEQKIFLEPELTLSDLAQKLKTNTSVLSAAINQNFNKNFNDFVNEFRVEEFKKQMQLPENKHLTLLAIAFDCGFNSKATFNRAVKKITGLSPKEL